MRKWTSTLVLGLAMAPLAYGNPAVFRDSMLMIDEAVVIVGETYQYFKHVKFQELPSGQLKILSADPRTLAQVSELSVAVLESEPVQVEVQVEGILSDPCVQLEPVSVSRSEDTFHIVIAETAPDPAALCIAQVVPYDVTIPLDVKDLEPGNYRVKVNDKDIDFDLN